ncbi:MAG: tRNA pseudouridine synthase A [Candidatus Shikimatogenerans sp. Tcar]|uniref:tRNA pseudouridine synthase A n=1 Tax=Candidatus Shikimatogenerans sp. Tcar TaxID=3158565 RepID=A0AAU7QSE5_9FLAO
MKRYFINIIFNGFIYKGWQKQKKCLNTIQNILEQKISLILKEKIKIISCSRTDKLVNAFSLYAHFDTYNKIKYNFLTILNKLLPIFIQIKDIFLVNNNLHARYSVLSRSYLYIINFKKNPFLYKKSFFLKKKINYRKLLCITSFIKNIKNFKKFTIKDVKNTICNIYNIKWIIINESFLFFYIEANRYLKYMIRCIIGTILKISTNKLSLIKFISNYYLKDKKYKNFLKYLVPSYALYLLNVKY